MVNKRIVAELVSRLSGVHLALFVGMVLITVPLAQAQEAGHGGEEAKAHKTPHYKHVVSLFGGAATHTQHNDTGGAIGLSYAYRFSHKWAAGVKMEYASSSLERDYLLLFGVVFEAAKHFELAAAIGGEKVEKEETEHGEVHKVKEEEVLLRLGAAYGFPLNHRLTLSPEFNVDIAGSHVTLVYGLVFSIGL